ncbi:MAG: hypothetical protein WKG00_15295 [Polyangiaceae bacterium]
MKRGAAHGMALLGAALVVGCTNDFGDLFHDGAGLAGGSGGGDPAAAGPGAVGSGSAGAGAAGPGTGGSAVALVGCDDGEREAYRDIAAEPNIAGCSGDFQLWGLEGKICRDVVGDDGGPGYGCQMDDLCADDWHVCRSAAEVMEHTSSDACPGDVPPGMFFATRQSMTDGHCTTNGKDDVVGCGELGEVIKTEHECSPLNRYLTLEICDSPDGDSWDCGDASARGADVLEGETFVITSPEGGGVLCCPDP